MQKLMFPYITWNRSDWVHIPFLMLFLAATALQATTYTSIRAGNYSSGSTWEGGEAPPIELNGNDVININHRVVLSGSTLKILGSTTININDVFILSGGSFEIDHNNAKVNITHGVVIVPNGNFLNKKGLVTLNEGGVQMCNSGYKDESSSAAHGTVGKGFIYTDNGDIDNIGSAPFSADINWCSENGGQTNMPTGEDCGNINPLPCTSEAFYLSLLPVELIAFTGQAEGKHVQLKWTTASEINNEKFVIEYAGDGTNFRVLDQIPGQGTTYETSNYSYLHQNAGNLGHEYIYYRLQQVDFDGTKKYSNTIAVRVRGQHTVVNIYPNPVNTGQGIKLKAAYIEFIEIMDGQGRIIESRKYEGVDHIELPIIDFQPGLYYIRINKMKVEKLVVLQ